MHLFNRFFARVASQASSRISSRVAARLSARFSSCVASVSCLSLRKRGFTLIELLIVIVIIGILAVGFAPTVLNAPKKARDAVRKGDLATIKQAIEAYAVDNSSTYPVTNNGSLCATLNTAFSGSTYFQGGKLPKDPTPASSACPNDGSYLFANFPNGKCYVLGTKLEVNGSGNSDASNIGMNFCGLTTPPTGAGSKDYSYTIVNY